MVAIVYENIEFEYDGHYISNYGDVHTLRKRFQKLRKDVSGLNNAVVTSVANFLDKKVSDAGPAFDIICKFKTNKNREVHCLPDFLAVQRAIKFYCANNSDIPYEKKEYSEKCFLIFAKKACELEQETVCYGNLSAELDS